VTVAAILSGGFFLHADGVEESQAVLALEGELILGSDLARVDAEALGFGEDVLAVLDELILGRPVHIHMLKFLVRAPDDLEVKLRFCSGLHLLVPLLHHPIHHLLLCGLPQLAHPDLLQNPPDHLDELETIKDIFETNCQLFADHAGLPEDASADGLGLGFGVDLGSGLEFCDEGLVEDIEDGNVLCEEGGSEAADEVLEVLVGDVFELCLECGDDVGGVW
jgi:hypothetical protein